MRMADITRENPSIQNTASMVNPSIINTSTSRVRNIIGSSMANTSDQNTYSVSDARNEMRSLMTNLGNGQSNLRPRLQQRSGVNFTNIYEQLFCSKVFFEAFFYLQLGLVIFLMEEYWRKNASKILVKLTTAVNFIKILQAAFAPIFLCQKITKPNCNQRKAAQTPFI